MIKDELEPDYLLFVVAEALSDKSVVYNVLLGEYKFPAVDRDAAKGLAEAIADAINTHTTTTADVIYEV